LSTSLSSWIPPKTLYNSLTILASISKSIGEYKIHQRMVLQW
jgi:hypothetical protein